MKKITISKSGIEGKGVFADEDIPAGARIQYITGKRVKKLPKTAEDALSIPTWFGLGRKIWIDPGETPFRYLNHSCAPTAAIQGTKTLVALKQIKRGEEITIDYSMTDADPLWQMSCQCNTSQCRKTIRSIHSLPPAVFQAHMPHIPRYFQRVYIRHYVNSQIKSQYGK